MNLVLTLLSMVAIVVSPRAQRCSWLRSFVSALERNTVDANARAGDRRDLRVERVPDVEHKDQFDGQRERPSSSRTDHEPRSLMTAATPELRRY